MVVVVTIHLYGRRLESVDGVGRMCLVYAKPTKDSANTKSVLELIADDIAELGISPNGSLACVENSLGVVQSLNPAGLRDATRNR